MGAEVIMFIGLFATIFGVYFLRSRENLSMIEKGINPRKNYGGPKPYTYMKYSLLLIGAGTGLLLAYGLDVHFFQRLANEKTINEALYFSLLAIGGGIGLFSAYKIERKELKDNNTEKPNE